MPKEKRLFLYRLTYSHAIGVHWLTMRECAPLVADLWLDQFQRDEPNARFILAHKPPKITKGDAEKALMAAAL